MVFAVLRSVRGKHLVNITRNFVELTKNYIYIYIYIKPKYL